MTREENSCGRRGKHCVAPPTLFGSIIAHAFTKSVRRRPFSRRTFNHIRIELVWRDFLPGIDRPSPVTWRTTERRQSEWAMINRQASVLPFFLETPRWFVDTRIESSSSKMKSNCIGFYLNIGRWEHTHARQQQSDDNDMILWIDYEQYMQNVHGGCAFKKQQTSTKNEMSSASNLTWCMFVSLSKERESVGSIWHQIKRARWP